jgi:hypothetical protein
MADEKTRPFQMRVAPEWLSMIDEWRRSQPDIPSRAEAIRRLVDMGLGRALTVNPDATVVQGSRTFHQDPKAYGN